MKGVFLLFISLQIHAATYYVLAGGLGSHSGADWSNANCRIPDPLAAGDIVYIGNSGGNLADTTTLCAGEATHVFSGSGSAGSHIVIKAATSVDHGTVVGWSASYGVDVTPKIIWSNTKIPSDGLTGPFWDFCGSYYDIDGQVGSSDTTGSYGFYFKSAGVMFGFIRADSHACSESSLTDLTFRKVEIDGVSANSINGFGGAAGFYMGSPVSATATVNNISITDFYLHDVWNPFGAEGRMTGLTLLRGWIYRNFGNAAAHSQGMEIQAGGGPYALNNLTVANTVWQDMQGTAFIVCLSGTCDGWKVYNNVFYYSSSWDSTCEYGDATATCGVSKLIGDNTPSGTITNSTFYGNTISNVHLKPGHAGADDAGVIIAISGSSGNSVQNNLWYNCTQGNVTGSPFVAHDYNTWSSTGSSSTTLAAHEYNNGAQPNPFINQYGNFQLTSESVNPHLSPWNPLASPYNVDILGVARTSSRGAYQYVPPSGTNFSGYGSGTIR